ncbi:cyclin N-terminal domain-containing protein 1-like isoform X2 [Nylanderia fulva]|uniref:cyclin N-terminal domain-containing protein 1-like isoform X2 n=1 Tax=Nylanderia fulva TaxID=613905 RepID=UPI0010FB9B06|nr:cyclin N-terminal domain-containing protein 1-like isoform X2 [Nylanderia fulva]
MNLDTAYIGPLIDDWMDHLKEIMREREQEIINEKRDLILPCVALTTHIMKAAIYIADCLTLEPHVKQHVKYMAVELFDKFMNKSFWEACNANMENNDEWYEVYQKKTCNYLKLYLVSCFQLASKMNSHANSLTITQVLELLQILDQNYECTQDMVSFMEKEIFKKVEFKMPLYTPVYCIEVLLTATGLGETPSTVEISMKLLDVAYLKYKTVYHHYQSYCLRQNILMSEEEKDLKLRILKSNTLFLSAAIVLCTTYFINSGISDSDIITKKIMADKLAELTDTNSTGITVMSNILFQIVMDK